jgi:metal-responsive CopG/Arc/MetJ family transcriptional regulator
MTEKRPISVQLDPQMVLALDALATSQKGSRSEALEGLLDLAIQAQEAERKRRTQKANLTLRLDATTAEQVKGVARARGESQNAAAVYLLEEGLKAQLDGQSAAAVESLAQELRAAVAGQQKAHDAQVHRLAYLLTRCVLESLATRNVANALLSVNGVDKASILSVTDAAWTSAVSTLKNPSPAMREALEELTRHG